MTFGIAPSRRWEESEVVRGQVLLSAARLDVRAQLENRKPAMLRRGYRDRNGEGYMHATATIAHSQQHMRALARANQVRLARAELKRKVASEEVGVADVILACPWEAHSMAVADLLMSQRRWGQTRCRRFL